MNANKDPNKSNVLLISLLSMRAGASLPELNDDPVLLPLLVPFPLPLLLPDVPDPFVDPPIPFFRSDGY